MTWAIQDNLLKQNQIEQIVNTLNESTIPWISLSLIPFCDTMTFLYPPKDNNLIPYGSTKLARLAYQANWKGLFFDKNTFNVEAWNVNRDDMLNSEAIITTVAEASQIFKQYDPSSVWFIRPTDDLKAFCGTVTTAEQIRIWKDSPDTRSFSFPDTTKVAISEWKNIHCESRYFIVGGKVVDGSVYKISGKLVSLHETDNKRLNSIQQLADKWLPHRVCVMDVADTDKGIKVIEFNCFNCSGFYDHDISRIITTVNDYFTHFLV